MTYQIIGVAALCAAVCTGATAETSADQSPGTYEGSIAAPQTVTHQAQLIAANTQKTWAPATFVMTDVSQPTVHQAQLVAASTKASWVAETYTSKDVAVILPLQHQAQLTALMIRYEWEISNAILSN